jgi:hypothetical protein
VIKEVTAKKPQVKKPTIPPIIMLKSIKRSILKDFILLYLSSLFYGVESVFYSSSFASSFSHSTEKNRMAQGLITR